MSKLPKKSLQRHSSASSARSWLRKRANGRDRVTVDGQDVRMPIVLDVQAPLKDSSMAELELWVRREWNGWGAVRLDGFGFG